MQLSEWLKINKKSYEEFGYLIGVTATAVYRYARGSRRPEDEKMIQIFSVTGGEVSPNDFYELPIKKNKRRKRSTPS